MKTKIVFLKVITFIILWGLAFVLLLFWSQAQGMLNGYGGIAGAIFIAVLVAIGTVSHVLWFIVRSLMHVKKTLKYKIIGGYVFATIIMLTIALLNSMGIQDILPLLLYSILYFLCISLYEYIGYKLD